MIADLKRRLVEAAGTTMVAFQTEQIRRVVADYEQLEADLKTVIDQRDRLQDENIRLVGVVSDLNARVGQPGDPGVHSDIHVDALDHAVATGEGMPEPPTE